MTFAYECELTRVNLLMNNVLQMKAVTNVKQLQYFSQMQ